MNSMKNAVVVVLLLGVAYGAYKVVNAPDPDQTLDAKTLAALENGIELEIPELDEITSVAAPQSSSKRQTDSSLRYAEPPTLPRLNQNKSSSLTAPPLNESDKAPQVGGRPSDTRSTTISPPPLAPPTLASSSQQPSNNDSQVASANTQDVSPNEMVTGSSAAATDRSESVFNPQPQTEMVGIVPKTTSNEVAPNLAQDTNPYVRDNLGLKPTESQANAAGSPLRSAATDSTAENQINPTTIASHLDWNKIRQLVEAEKYREALKLLSEIHRSNPRHEQREDIVAWLDSLAFKVIYSNEHHLTGRPYSVQPGETIFSIAERWSVPAELVYRINHSEIASPDQLTPGTNLKVVQGPFDAEVNIQTGELTLYLGDLYAGRFTVAIGNDASDLQRGVFNVIAKSDQGRVYRDTNGRSYAINDQSNPYGTYWFGLDEQTCIHSSNSVADNRGCIRLDEEDAADLYRMLSAESQVIIR